MLQSHNITKIFLLPNIFFVDNFTLKVIIFFCLKITSSEIEILPIVIMLFTSKYYVVRNKNISNDIF